MNLYVGNLSFRVNEAELGHFMEDFGTVNSVRIITDRETRRSRGFAFVEMENDDEARTAIERLNGTEFNGRPLVVREALPRK